MDAQRFQVTEKFRYGTFKGKSEFDTANQEAQQNFKLN